MGKSIIYTEENIHQKDNFFPSEIEVVLTNDNRMLFLIKDGLTSPYYSGVYLSISDAKDFISEIEKAIKRVEQERILNEK